jgi:hypothetical protein
VHIEPSSYRDNSGFVFLDEGRIYRSINKSYFSQYNQLMNSGLYEKLISKKLLIEHNEILNPKFTFDKTIQPVQLPLISYAYEWSFSMLQDAAVCTLNNALTSLDFGMIIKDANTHNIQFYKGKPILIDSLSFEMYNEGEGWIAYHQFCECFLAPLLLMKYNHTSMNKLMIVYPEGIPMDVCVSLLPMRAKMNLNVFLHFVIPSRIRKDETKSKNEKAKSFSKQKLITLLNGLKDFVKSLKPKNHKTTWDNYYSETILDNYLDVKKKMVTNYLASIPFKSLTDLGTNDGEFSLPLANTDKQITSVDFDTNCIERLYLHCKKNKIKNLNSIISDLSAPTPSVGWNAEERPGILKRLNSDVTMGLALIHHIAISKNVPLDKICSLFANLSPYAIIEFVAKEDPKVQALLQTREDIFNDYTLEGFRKHANNYFEIIREEKVGDQSRWLFLLKRK